jgi:hypothetical protein
LNEKPVRQPEEECNHIYVFDIKKYGIWEDNSANWLGQPTVAAAQSVFRDDGANARCRLLRRYRGPDPVFAGMTKTGYWVIIYVAMYGYQPR